jgi:hypothetical protein
LGCGEQDVAPVDVPRVKPGPYRLSFARGRATLQGAAMTRTLAPAFRCFHRIQAFAGMTGSGLLAGSCGVADVAGAQNSNCQ